MTLRDSQPQKNPFSKFTGKVTALEVWNPKTQRDLEQSLGRRQSSQGKGSGRKAELQEKRTWKRQRGSQRESAKSQGVRTCDPEDPSCSERSPARAAAHHFYQQDSMQSSPPHWVANPGRISQTTYKHQAEKKDSTARGEGMQKDDVKIRE